MGDCFWPDRLHRRWDHLFSQEVCYCPKIERDLGLGNQVSKNIALAAECLWHFFFTTLLYLAPSGPKIGLDQNFEMDEMPNRGENGLDLAML